MIVIRRANNEQKGYTEEELGVPVVGMEQKSKTGIRQTGDYYAEVDGGVHTTLFERKSLEDFYGSTVMDKNRKRLYAEIERFHRDDRFTRFVILVEATPGDYLRYFPWAVLLWHKKKGDVPRFCGIARKKKATVLQHLEDRGAEVIFAGSRKGAIGYIRAEVGV